MNWHEADSRCQSWFGTSLASVHSAAENDEMAQLFASASGGSSSEVRYGWFGANDIEIGGMGYICTPLSFIIVILIDHRFGSE